MNSIVIKSTKKTKRDNSQILNRFTVLIEFKVIFARDDRELIWAYRQRRLIYPLIIIYRAIKNQYGWL